MQKGASVDVPEADCEVDGSRDEVRNLVARVLVVGVEKAVDPTGMANQNLMWVRVEFTAISFYLDLPLI